MFLKNVIFTYNSKKVIYSFFPSDKITIKISFFPGDNIWLFKKAHFPRFNFLDNITKNCLNFPRYKFL